jgi:hypothetical protein
MSPIRGSDRPSARPSLRAGQEASQNFIFFAKYDDHGIADVVFNDNVAGNDPVVVCLLCNDQRRLEAAVRMLQTWQMYWSARM